MKKILKKWQLIFLSCVLAFAPAYVYASAAEKWEVLENVYDHTTQKVHIEARKITQQAANSGRYKVEVPVNPSSLGTTVKRMLWVGVAVAGVEAMLEGIGWIIDTGSQVIKRPKESDASQNNNNEYLWYNGNDGKFYNTPRDAALAMLAVLKADFPWLIDLTTVTIISPNRIAYDVSRESGEDISQYISAKRIPNPAYDPNLPPPAVQYEYLSDTALGNEIMGLGENLNPLALAIQEAYSPNNPLAEPAPEATRQALEIANPQPETEPKGEAETEQEIDPETGEQTGNEKTTFELPNFCSWAPAVCDFFSVQKQDNKDIKENQNKDLDQNKTFFDSVKDFFDWTKEEDLPNRDTSDITLPDTPITPQTVNVNFGKTCPAPTTVNISFAGQSKEITIMNYQFICEWSWVVEYSVIALASISSVFIVAGRKS